MNQIRGKVLVTGGAGFIGSHLVERLIKEGLEVIVLDNLATGSKANLAAVMEDSRFSFFQVDIGKLDKIESYFKNVDWVFHLAALADIVPSIVAPYKYHQANVNGTVAVLEAARLRKVRKFVYIASSSCYGIPDIYPTPETAEIKPQYPYALTKYLGECYAMHWCQIYKLPVVSLRLFNVYGPRARTAGTYGAVFGVFLAQKINNQPFTVVGDGKQTRDFTFVADVVEAIIAAAKSDIAGEALNVGSGNTYSVNELVSLLEGEVVHVPKRPGEPDCTFADIAKIRSLLKWEPHFSFAEGVKIMLNNINNWRGAPLWTPGSISEATKDWFRYLSR